MTSGNDWPTVVRVPPIFTRRGVASGRKVGCYLTRTDYQRIVDLSLAADVPIADLVRRALEQVIPTWEVAVKKDRQALAWGAYRRTT